MAFVGDGALSMSVKSVTVVDYGRGNLFSVQRAIERCGGRVSFASTPEELEKADRLILPGVGAYADAMEALRSRKLVHPILEFLGRGDPFLGICLGMQLLFRESEEFGRHQGLGWIPGVVRQIPQTKIDGTPHKIPHIGWNSLQESLDFASTWNNPLLHNVRPNSSVYFVHSFSCKPENPKYEVAHADYNGRPVCALLHVESVFATQFHPEKSGPVGLKMIENFLNL